MCLTEVLGLRGVSHRLPDGRLLFDEFDFALHAGDRVAIMGPSGAGKSTLLAIAGGLLRPTIGDVVRDPDISDRDIAWVVQHTAVLAHRSVRDNVALPLLAQGLSWSAARDRVAAALDVTALTTVAATRAATISGGERQRVGVARAIASGAAIVIADEPTASLDGELVGRVTAALVRGTAPSVAVLVATHDPRVAQECDRVVTLGAAVPAVPAVPAG